MLQLVKKWSKWTSRLVFPHFEHSIVEKVEQRKKSLHLYGTLCRVMKKKNFSKSAFPSLFLLPLFEWSYSDHVLPLWLARIVQSFENFLTTLFHAKMECPCTKLQCNHIYLVAKFYSSTTVVTSRRWFTFLLQSLPNVCFHFISAEIHCRSRL